MERIIDAKLLEWKENSRRKPLIIRGARQVGKSWSIVYFGKKYYEGSIHIVNFEKNKEIAAIFEYNLDVKRIKIELEIALTTKIDTNKDLLFFDEIQACPKALMALRYFYEDMPQLHIIAAGSLLDFVLKDISYPVGRVEQLDMHPLNFYEFLNAIGQTQLAAILTQKPFALSETIDGLMKLHLTRYFLVGGMPACVNAFLEQQSMIVVYKIQDDLIYSIKEDFKKYNTKISVDCLNDILTAAAQSIGQQIKFTSLSDRFSSPTIKKGFELLKTARILHQVQNVSLAGLPLTPSGIQFKAIFLDIGLWLRISKLPFENLFGTENILAGFKGAMAEQFVGQQLKATSKTELYYWANTNSGTISEIDFVTIMETDIVPIEVKSGRNGSLKSLHYALSKNINIKKALVLSNTRFGIENNIEFLPLYWAGNI